MGIWTVPWGLGVFSRRRICKLEEKVGDEEGNRHPECHGAGGADLDHLGQGEGDLGIELLLEVVEADLVADLLVVALLPHAFPLLG